MIYNKDASFPYPVLSRTANSYQENYFTFDINDVKETKDSYIFSFEYTISSPFIEQLINQGKAVVVFIAQSKDNTFKRLDPNTREIVFPKKRFSLSERTKLQLHIQTLTNVSFSEATDLNEFYNEFKDDIVVKSHSLLGYSDEVVLESNDIKPLEVFEQAIRPNLSVPFKVELTNETIVLAFRTQNDSLSGAGLTANLRNMYLYVGLSHALRNFIEAYGQDEEFVQIENITMPDTGLHEKLKDLMLSKNITELSVETIDETIQLMADNIIEKYIESIRGISEHAD
jgi:hypothetical protein